ncbi:MAG: GHKL domain-containing protein [Calditrichaeota bacterium]|nr:MAG: GHKL domain-containing protein [Calditrichota bacterium]
MWAKNVTSAILIGGWLFMLACNMFLGATPPEEAKLRFFPEFRGEFFKHLSVPSPRYAVGIVEGELWEWDGRDWHPFPVPFPVRLGHVDFFEAFSSTSIWIFFRPEERFYYTRIRRFDGKRWRTVPAAHPFTITTASFLDSLRFVAGGHWGGLVYFDGRDAHNLPAFPFTEVRWIKAFTPDHFLVLIRPRESEKRCDLMEYTSGRWRKVTQFPNLPVLFSLFTPDSGLCVLPEDPILYQYFDGKLIPLDSLRDIKNGSIIEVEHKLYFLSGGTLYSWYGTLRPVARLDDLKGRLHSFNGQDFFICSTDGLYYWGARDIGLIVSPSRHPIFEFQQINSQGGYSGHLGLGLYRNGNGDIEGYFTRSDQRNDFYRFSSTSSLPFMNEYEQRELWGVFRKGGNNHWDAVTYFVDLDNDGDADALSAASRGSSRLYENIGDDRFRDVTGEADFHLTGRTVQVCWMDVDNDGWLDFWAGDENDTLRVFRNRKFFRFEDITAQLRLPPLPKGALPAAADMDGDGDQDVLIYAISRPIQLLYNKGVDSQTGLPIFVDVSAESPELTTRFDFFVQSVAFGDYDNDGDLDLFLANRVSPCKLFRNDGKGRFRDVSAGAGVERSFLAYGANWADLDQDGDLDIFLSTLGRNFIFWNHNGQRFEPDSLCLAQNKPAYTTGSAPADVDGDGDLDIVVANQYIGFSGVWVNQLDRANAITVELKGKHHHTQGLGGRVWLYEQLSDDSLGNLCGYREISLNTGYYTSGLPEAYFGVRPGRRYVAVVRFPSGHLQRYGPLIPGKRYAFTDEVSISAVELATTWMASIVYRHRRRELALRLAAYAILLGLALWIILRRFSWTPASLGMYVLTFTSLYVLASIPVYGSLRMMALLFPVYISIFLGGGLIGLFQWLHISRFQEEARKELFTIVQEFYHTHTGMNRMEHLLFYSKNIPRVRSPKQTEMIQEFLQELELFRNYTLSQLYRAYRQCAYFRRVPISPGAARRKLKAVERLVKRFSLNLPQGKFFRYLQEFHRLTGSVLEDIRRIRRHVERLHSSDLLRVIGEITGAFPGLHRVLLNNATGRDSLPVIIPRDELAQVLANLLSNAVEAMKEEKQREVEIHISFSENATVEVRLRDRGPGIPPEIASLIFEETFSTKGTSGLGLFHARQIVRRYGGELQLCPDSSGDGAAFCITLRECTIT